MLKKFRALSNIFCCCKPHQLYGHLSECNQNFENVKTAYPSVGLTSRNSQILTEVTFADKQSTLISIDGYKGLCIATLICV